MSLGEVGVSRYLYDFSFESPEDARSNRYNKTDFLSAREFWIVAESPEAALAWGREVSRAYMRWLYAFATDKSEVGSLYPGDVVTYPAILATASSLDLLSVEAGELPDFKMLKGNSSELGAIGTPCRPGPCQS